MVRFCTDRHAFPIAWCVSAPIGMLTHCFIELKVKVSWLFVSSLYIWYLIHYLWKFMCSHERLLLCYVWSYVFTNHYGGHQWACRSSRGLGSGEWWCSLTRRSLPPEGLLHSCCWERMGCDVARSWPGVKSQVVGDIAEGEWNLTQRFAGSFTWDTFGPW